MIIANFTPDTIEWMHGGINGVLKTNDVKEFDESRGNHILNEYTPRGLLRMEYNDDPEIKKKEAMAIYTRFWEKQVVVFNQHNERLKNENKAFVMATPQLETKAKEMGIELVGPWKLKIPAQNKEIERLQRENRELGSKFDKLQDQMADLIQTITSERQATTMEKDIYIKQFKQRSKANYLPWVRLNVDKIRSWPPDIQEEAHMKFLAFYGDEETWPLDEE